MEMATATGMAAAVARAKRTAGAGIRKEEPALPVAEDIREKEEPAGARRRASTATGMVREMATMVAAVTVVVVETRGTLAAAATAEVAREARAVELAAPRAEERTGAARVATMAAMAMGIPGGTVVATAMGMAGEMETATVGEMGMGTATAMAMVAGRGTGMGMAIDEPDAHWIADWRGDRVAVKADDR
jgi:hypothetical protein